VKNLEHIKGEDCCPFFKHGRLVASARRGCRWEATHSRTPRLGQDALHRTALAEPSRLPRTPETSRVSTGR